MFIRWPRDVFIPDATCNRVEHDPLKTMIIADRPIASLCARPFEHDSPREVQILIYQLLPFVLADITGHFHTCIALFDTGTVGDKFRKGVKLSAGDL